MDWRLTRRAPTSRGEVAFEVLGEGPPVVLTHGTPSRSAMWRHVAEDLVGHHQVFVWDLLGSGESERAIEQDVSLVAHGEVLAELIDRWGLVRPTLVGHDIGGAVVLRAHLLHEVRASGLALLDTAVLSPWITPRTRQMQRDVDRWSSLPDPQLAVVIAEHLHSTTTRPLPPETFAALFEQWDGEVGQRLYLRNLAQLHEEHTAEVERRLPSIDLPTLIVWGEDDAWLPVDTSVRLAALIPGARRLIIPSAGHFCMEDQPQHVGSALRDFCADVVARA